MLFPTRRSQNSACFPRKERLPATVSGPSMRFSKPELTLIHLTADETCHELIAIDADPAL